jgi:hypothetical protein
MRLGKVVKSNSHCDYVVQVDDSMDVIEPPAADDYGFGRFVKLANADRPPVIGVIYNSLLFNPLFFNNGPRLSSEPDPLFTPDLINETRTLLGTVLIGTLEVENDRPYGRQGIPREVIPVNTPVTRLDSDEIYRFHLNAIGQPQFRYYSLLLRYGGSFASHLAEQVLQEMASLNLFKAQEQRALEVLCREITWRNTMGSMQ